MNLRGKLGRRGVRRRNGEKEMKLELKKKKKKGTRRWEENTFYGIAREDEKQDSRRVGVDGKK